jgi:hypothetical protein
MLLSELQRQNFIAKFGLENPDKSKSETVELSTLNYWDSTFALFIVGTTKRF